MDIKIEGLSYELLSNALNQAKEGRIHILNKMLETITSPRLEVKEYAPKISKLKINKSVIGTVIGPGGKNIQALQNNTDTIISIQEDGEFGVVEIMGYSKEKINNAKDSIS